MTLDDANEAAAVLTTALTALQAAVPGQSGRQGAVFRYACGDLAAQAVALIQAGASGTPLQACFAAAVTAGATLQGMDALRDAVLATAPSGQPGLYILGSCLCLGLSAEAEILSAYPFVSSQAALGSLAYFSAMIGVVQDWTLDNHLSAQYQTLLVLGAAVVRDMQTRAAPLPRLTTYSFPRGTSSLVLAYRLYGDAGRADELRGENSANHPAFMPASGTALSQ